MARPEELTIAEVVKSEEWDGNDGPMCTDEIRFEGEQGTWKVHRQASAASLESGQTVRGWKNEGRKFGLAKEQSENGAQRPSKGATGQAELSPDRTRSIERQTCVKAAGPILAANFDKKTFAQDAMFVVDALHEAVRGEKSDQDIAFQVADLMFVAPDRRRAERELEFYAAPPTLFGPDVTWQLGEEAYWFRVEHRVGRGWCIVRRVRGEQIEEPPY